MTNIREERRGTGLELLRNAKVVVIEIVAELAARAQVLPIERALQGIMTMKGFRTSFLDVFLDQASSASFLKKCDVGLSNSLLSTPVLENT